MSKSKRERHVFPTDEIAHLWAHKTQADARNSAGNFYFHGDTIYSYGNHFPIARHVTSKSGRKRAILFTNRTYSNTTSKHLGMVRRAIPPDVTVFDVDYILDYSAFTHRENLAGFATVAKRDVDKAAKCRKSGSRTLTEAFGLRETAKEYCKFFGIKFQASEWKFLPTGKALTNLRSKLADREARAKVLDDVRRIRERAEWEAQTAARKAEEDAWNESGVCMHEPRHDAHQWGQVRACEQLRGDAEWEAKSGEIIARWRTGDPTAVLRHGYSLPAMLRVSPDGDELETSKGARIPMSHDVRGLKFVRAIVVKGEDWQRNGHTFHLGYYSLDRVEANGTVHAGCHVIDYAEIERVAPQVEAWAVGHSAEVRAADDAEDNSGRANERLEGEAMPRTVHDLLPGDSANGT